MSVSAWLSAAWWPWRMAISAWYATLYPSERCPVPQARTVDEAAAYVDQIRANYKHDPALPWGGELDYTEDPRRVEWYRRSGRLAEFPGGLDCDDVAYYAKACLWDLVPSATVWVLIDRGPQALHHCVCMARFGGTWWSLDTNGLRIHRSGNPCEVFRAIYPGADYEAYPTAGYQFPDPRAV